MREDKILILYTCPPEDTESLYLSLKSLELTFPETDTEVAVFIDPELSPATDGLKGVHFYRLGGKVGEGMVEAVQQLDPTFVVLSHPDVLFLRKDWSDLLLSRMIDSGIHCMGLNKFIQLTGAGGQKFNTLPSGFLILTRECFDEIGSRGGDGSVRGAIYHVACTKRKIASVGAGMDGIIHHYGLCSYDRNELDSQRIMDIQNEFKDSGV